MALKISPDLSPECDLAWAAGLFEGEGTITIARRGQDDTYRLQAMVGNTDEQVVDYFHHRWGGWKTPFYGKRPGRQPGWMWLSTAGTAETFVRDIEPYLRTLRVWHKARIALHFRRHQATWRGPASDPDYKVNQRSVYLEMRYLNRRGLRPGLVAA